MLLACLDAILERLFVTVFQNRNTINSSFAFAVRTASSNVEALSAQRTLRSIVRKAPRQCGGADRVPRIRAVVADRQISRWIFVVR